MFNFDYNILTMELNMLKGTDYARRSGAYCMEDIKMTQRLYGSMCAAFQIKNVIFNPPATIVFWKDGTKTVVKARNEIFDEEKGLAMAMVKKYNGNQGNYFNEFKKWVPERIIKRDDKGRLIYIKQVDGTETWFEYDENGNGTRLKTKGYERWSKYDKNGCLLIQRDTQGMDHRFEYNDNGDLIREVKNGEETKYEYNKKGLLVRIVCSNGDEEEYTYDACGNLIRHKSVDHNGIIKTITNQYNEEGRLLRSREVIDYTNETIEIED